MIASGADIETRMKPGAPLPNEDRSGRDHLSAEGLDAESFGLAVTAVLC
jgi:hypothetical protein